MIRYIDSLIEKRFKRIGNEKFYEQHCKFTKLVLLASIVLVGIPALIWGRSLYFKISTSVGLILSTLLAIVYYRVLIVYRRLFASDNQDKKESSNPKDNP